MKRALLLALVAYCAACARDADNGGDSSRPAVPQLDIEIVRRIPHDAAAYTQGLVYHGGLLYESTGRYGESTIRIVDPATGAVKQSAKLPENVFGEGLAWANGDLVQLSWKEFIAFYYDPATLKVEKSVDFKGEGWGLCYDGSAFYMTSGDDKLIKRDSTFAPAGTIQITYNGQPLYQANELECVDQYVWANVYLNNRIVKIDKASGTVVAEADATSLLPASIPRDADHVLNGIAYNPATQTFFITGKLWPEMYEVRFVPR